MASLPHEWKIKAIENLIFDFNYKILAFSIIILDENILKFI